MTSSGRGLPVLTALQRTALAALLLAVAGCASSQDVAEVRNEVRILSARQDSAFRVLMRAVAQGNEAALDSVRAIADELFEFRGEVNQRLQSIQEQQLRVGELVGQSQRGLQDLQGEVNAQRLAMERQQQAAARAAAEADSAEAGSAAAAPSSSADPPAADPDPADEQLPDPAEELYQAASSTLDRGNFGTARRGFQQFVAEYPNHALTPGAYLHLGELASNEDLLDEAIAHYQQILELFPAADEVPHALYRTGVLHIEMGECEQAVQYLQRLVNTYEDHLLIPRAQDRLQECP